MSHSNWTNRQQKEKLIRLMEANPEVAKGFSTNRVDMERFWKNAADDLNSCGPPTKDGTTWKKVWADFKSKTEKKLVDNEIRRKQSGFNDNNLIKLTEEEKAVVRITSLSQAVTGINARVFGFNQTEETQAIRDLPASTSATSRNISMSSFTDENVEPDAVEQESNDEQPVRNKPKKETPIQLLQKQNEAQQEFHTNMSNKLTDISNELHRMNRNLQRLEDRFKKSGDERKRHNLAVEKIMHEKLLLKKSLIEAQIESIRDQIESK